MNTTSDAGEPFVEKMPLSWLGSRPEIPLSIFLFIAIAAGWELAR